MTKDLQKRVIFGGIALLFFIPTVMVGGVLPDCDWLDRHAWGS